MGRLDGGGAVAQPGEDEFLGRAVGGVAVICNVVVNTAGLVVDAGHFVLGRQPAYLVGNLRPGVIAVVDADGSAQRDVAVQIQDLITGQAADVLHITQQQVVRLFAVHQNIQRLAVVHVEGHRVVGPSGVVFIFRLEVYGVHVGQRTGADLFDRDCIAAVIGGILLARLHAEGKLAGFLIIGDDALIDQRVVAGNLKLELAFVQAVEMAQQPVDLQGAGIVEQIGVFRLIQLYHSRRRIDQNIGRRRQSGVVERMLNLHRHRVAGNVALGNFRNIRRRNGKAGDVAQVVLRAVAVGFYRLGTTAERLGVQLALVELHRKVRVHRRFYVGAVLINNIG